MQADQDDYLTVLKNPLFPTGKNPPALGPKTHKKRQSTKALLEPLNALTGMGPLKQEIGVLVDLVKVHKRRAKLGLKSEPLCMHMVFTGNPGTGKTTAARLVGEILHGLGLLSRGHVVEVSRADLVGDWIGHSESKTRAKIAAAKGGVLFIDEAYTLTSNSYDGDFGWNVVDVLSKEMEDCRDDLMVIVAGYKDDMGLFLKATPGLASRFSYTVDFPDYTPEELQKIFEGLCGDQDYRLSLKAGDKLSAALISLKKQAGKNFGNGRYMRQLFEKAIRAQAQRIVKKRNITREEMMMIEAEDFDCEAPVTKSRVTYLK